MTSPDTVTKAAEIAPHSRLAEVIASRADLFALTQDTETAALRPRQPGGLSHAERAALACRIARLNNALPLAAYYEQNLDAIGSTAVLRQIADPGHTSVNDARLAALLRHVDLVTTAPKNASQADIQALSQAGLSDADIVRLSELIAFVNYQLRLIAGLRLMGTRAEQTA